MPALPTSLYIHIPWCIKKCPYCDFNSYAQQATPPYTAYVDRLLADLSAALPTFEHHPACQTIFFGGGTPSLLPTNELERLLAGLAKRLSFAPDIEITLEMNPGTYEHGKLSTYRDLGINRLSIGAQSFDAQQLRTLGRIHNPTETLQLLAELCDLGWENYNIDIMHSLPNQTCEQAMADLTQALAFAPPHLSWYQLTIEPNTLFHRYRPVLPSDDRQADIQNAGYALLAQAGYQHYEVSAFAKPQQACQHNLNYWRFGDYLGIGAGAHSKFTLAPGQVMRQWRQRYPKSYLEPKLPFIAGQQLINQPAELGFEYMLNQLRLNESFSNQTLHAHTGLHLADLTKPLATAVDKQLLTVANGTVAKTELGQRFLNDLTGLFLAQSRS